MHNSSSHCKVRILNSCAAAEQIKFLEELITKYPIDSIEDGLDENDWDNWVKLTAAIGDRCQLVGDDLFVTNVKFLEKGIKMMCQDRKSVV